MNDLTNIDPEWAWQPFRPDAQHPWNAALAAHLFRRAGFAASRGELEQAVAQKPADVVQRLLDPGSAAAEFAQDSQQFADTILATGDPRQLSAWWVYVMLGTPHPLLEKTTLFWHGHFATSAEKVQDARAMYDQNQLLRDQALGNFVTLVHEVSRDAAMLLYLDSATNRKAHPNENFARELMELFCLGEGNYSERDVQQLARCFTGWEIRRGKFRFNRYQHDTAEKTILGETDAFPEGAAIDLVLRQAAGPRFIVAKLINYFVFDEPAAPPALVEPLAVALREQAWDIGHVVRRILGSNLFFSTFALGRKVRSPVELAVGLLRALEGSTNAHALAEDLFQLGQGLFYPPNVKGWDGGRAWINSSTLLGRANLVGRLVRDEKTRFGGADLAGYFDRLGADAPAAIVDTLIELAMAVTPSPEARQQLIGIIEQGRGDRGERIAAAIHAMSTLPEFQLA